MELLQVADTVAREKLIDREIILEAMEEAIQKAGRSKYGYDYDIRATIDRKSGDITLERYREIVEDVEEESSQIPFKDATHLKKDAKIGEYIIDELPPIDFGRVAAQTAKQVIIQKVREAERERQFEEYKDRTGEIVNGIVKRVEYGNAIIDLGRAEALLRRDESIPREILKNGDRVRAYIHDVRQEQRGPQIFLSRTHPEFMAGLFTQEVPEIYDGIIEIKGIARDPGSRAKIAVISNDASIDPVGACVGMKGSRVQAIVNELQGEKIDIIPWSFDVATFVINALAPAEIQKVVIDEEKQRIDVVVPEDQLPLAIGRRGQNVRLASILSGMDIDILTDDEESERRNVEFKERSETFMEGLDVDDVIAHLLVAEGFRSNEEIFETPVEELAQIEGFDEDIAQELKNRAGTWLKLREEQFNKQVKTLELKESLLEIDGLDQDMFVKLGEAGIKTRDDLADLAGDELVEIVGENKMSMSDANKIIMDSRAHWFAEEESALEKDNEVNASDDADAK